MERRRELTRAGAGGGSVLRHGLAERRFTFSERDAAEEPGGRPVPGRERGGRRNSNLAAVKGNAYVYGETRPLMSLSRSAGERRRRARRTPLRCCQVPKRGERRELES